MLQLATVYRGTTTHTLNAEFQLLSANLRACGVNMWLTFFLRMAISLERRSSHCPAKVVNQVVNHRSDPPKAVNRWRTHPRVNGRGGAFRADYSSQSELVPACLPLSIRT